MIELVVLGSGTGVPSRRRGAAGYVLQMRGGPLLFDCGPGTVTRLVANHVDPTAIDRVYLSHLHPDHCADLIALVFANSWTPRVPQGASAGGDRSGGDRPVAGASLRGVCRGCVPGRGTRWWRNGRREGPSGRAAR